MYEKRLCGRRHKYGGVRGKAFLAQARRARRAYPSWVCKERATKPAAKRTAARRVALLWAWGVVARRSQPHFGGCSLLAPSPKPKATQRTSPYLCLRPLGCGAAIRLPGLLEGAGGAGEEEGKLMAWLKGLPGAQAPFGPFGQAKSSHLGIQLTPPTATAGVSVFMPAPPTMFLYGDGWWTTACSSKRKNSLPREREVRRLNRKVNSSK